MNHQSDPSPHGENGQPANGDNAESELPVSREALEALRALLHHQQDAEAWDDLRATLVTICELQSKCARRIHSVVQALSDQLGPDASSERQITSIKAMAAALETAAGKMCAQMTRKGGVMEFHLPLALSEQNNRLTPLLGFCDLLSGGTRDAEVLECLDRIQRDSDNLVALLGISLREIKRPALEKLGWWNVPN